MILLIERLDLRQHFGRKGRAAKAKGSQEQVVRSQILWWTPPGCYLALVDDPLSDPDNDALRDLFLNGKTSANARS